MTAAQKNYHARMQRALEYVDAHLGDELDLTTLSQVAAFSRFHFHRQFSATFGLSVHRYVQLARLKRASQALVWDNRQHHDHSDGCRIRRTGCVRPCLSATAGAIAFVVPDVTRLVFVALGLRAFG